jgi:hypothetical protein
MTRIFICYRRDDSADITGRIFEHLRAHFDKSVLFRDVDVIPFGSDFRQVIRKAVEDCQVLLAVIGPTWLNIAAKTGTRRLDDPHDFVRLEIETALKRNIPVIPVLVGKAAMPEPDQLPDSLQPLVFRHGLEVRRDPDFHRDVDTLIRGLTGLLETQQIAQSKDFRLILEAFHADNIDPQVVREKLVDLYRALNQYNLAKYGRRLTLEKFNQYLSADIPVEA